MKDVPELYENRLLVVLEDIDTGVFRQVLLNAAQFKRVSDAILTDEWKDDELREGFNMVEMNLDDEREIPADTFIGMKSIYEAD